MSTAIEVETTEDVAAFGLTQREVAERMGVSRQRVFALEQRALAKMRSAIRRFAEADGVSVADWLNGETAAE